MDGKLINSKESLENPNYWFIFGWCQHIDETLGQTLCEEDFYAGRIDGSNPTAESSCTQYSGSSPSKDITTSEMEGNPMTIKRMTGGDIFSSQ